MEASEREGLTLIHAFDDPVVLACLLALSAWRGGLNTIAGWFGVTGYPPAVLFAVATLFILLVLLHYSTVISKLTDENVELAQRIERSGRAARVERYRVGASVGAHTGPDSFGAFWRPAS